MKSKGSEDRTASPLLFAQAYGHFRGGYDGSAEQDPDDFVDDLLTRLQNEHDYMEAMKEGNSKDSKASRRRESVVETLFEGKTATRVRLSQTYNAHC